MKALEGQQIKRLLALCKAAQEHPERGIDIEAYASEKGWDLPYGAEGFKRSFEAQPLFCGWLNYHVTWEVHFRMTDDGPVGDPWKVIKLDKSRVQIHNEAVASRLPTLMPDGSVVEAEGMEGIENREAEAWEAHQAEGRDEE